MVEPTSPDTEYDVLPIPHIDVSSPDGPASLNDQDGAAHGICIPFSSIHSPPLSFKAQKRQVFVPGQDIEVKITAYERSVTTHLLSPNLYTIELKHGDCTWTIKKRYKHIQHLHQQLKLFRTSLNIPFPTRTHRERRSSFKLDYQNSRVKRKSRGALPRFPSKPEALVPYENIEERMQQLEKYLQNLLQINLYRNHHETISFLEVSQLSFVKDLEMPEKGKEGLVQKRTGSTQAGCNFCGLLDRFICVRCSYLISDLCGTWRKRWLFVKDTYIGYMRPKDGHVKCVLLFDSGFDVSSGIYSTGLNHGLMIANQNRQIVVKCWTKRKKKEWLSYLKEIAFSHELEQCGYGTVPGRDFTQKNRHNSYAPERTNVDAAWFVDGSSYMAAVADALEAAKEEIFIADWWLSPEIHMKRPAVDDNYWRLDKILQRKAAEGVKIFVLLYKEVEMALGINSFYSKQTLVKQHPENVKVLRHPDHAKVGVFLWAHHEKIVVIDQSYAFLGGIDLCYGRWDDRKHRLADMGNASQTLGYFVPIGKKQTSSNPTANPNVPRTIMKLAVATNMVGVGVLATSQTSLDREHAEHIKCNTPPSERRSFIEVMREKTESAKQRSKALVSSWLTPHSEEDDEDATGSEEQTPPPPLSPPSETREVNGNVSGMVGIAKYWLGKDYTNFIVKDFTNLDLPYQDLVDRETTPRMPWHDIGVMVNGVSARDVARHFIHRWNAVKLEKAKVSSSYPFLLPKTYEDLGPFQPVTDVPMHQVNCQVLRSASSWSAGFVDADMYEESIHEAYIDVINKAKHYVYIENQFFISLAAHNSSVRNQICETLFKRIIRAHKEGSVFRVFVIMPLLPGFEGEVGGPTGTALHAITHWNYASICRGKDSILNRLKSAGVEDPSEYITFHGLRTHSVLNGELVTELIYVHSKLLIADDRVVICGSANINDRSMLGKRDSEIAVIIEDTEFETGMMDGAPYQCGVYASSLRRNLFSEHLGQQLGLDDDPVCGDFYRDVWQSSSKQNTRLFEEVFRCIPTDSVKTFQSLKLYQEVRSLDIVDPPTASNKLDDVQGHLVDLPLEFLCFEVLTPNPTSMEGMMPTSLWT